MKKLVLSVLISLLSSLGLSGNAQAITNGHFDDGLHPYVGLLVFDVEGEPAWRCSGTLLSPTVVLTAGHCTDGADAARIWFDAVVEGNPEYPYGGSTSYEGIPYTHPDYCSECGPGLPTFAAYDVGVVVLTEPVPAEEVSEYGMLPAPGVVDALPNKADLALVGYGVQEQEHGGGPPEWTGLLVRLYAWSELISGNFRHSDLFIRATQNPGGGTGGVCFGDSGGPILDRSTDTVLAVSSYVTNSNCAGVAYHQRVDLPAVLAWVQGFLAP